MKRLLILIYITVFTQIVWAQHITITPNGITPESITYPRLTHSEIMDLANPQTGDLAYDKTFKCLRLYNGDRWLCNNQNIWPPSPNVTMQDAVVESEIGGAIGNKLITDQDDNLYITGIFSGAVDFGGITKTSTSIFGDYFLVKYNAHGEILWLKTQLTTGFGHLTGIDIDPVGNVYLLGSFTDSLTIGTYTFYSPGQPSLFIAKYTSEGSLIWAKNAGTGEAIEANSIKSDGSGNLWVYGGFENALEMGGQNYPANSNRDFFLAKLNSSGSVTELIHGSSSLSILEGALTIDAQGKILISGLFIGSIGFGSNQLVSMTGLSLFVAKYDPGTFEWLWAKMGSGISIPFSKNQLKTDNNNNVYITGMFAGETMNLSTLSVSKNLGAQAESFIAKLNSAGSPVWLRKTGTMHGYTFNQDIALDGDGNIYIEGAIEGVVDLENGQTLNGYRFNPYMAKYDSGGNLKWVQTVNELHKSIGPPGSEISGISIDSRGNIYGTGPIIKVSESTQNESYIIFYRLDNP